MGQMRGKKKVKKLGMRERDVEERKIYFNFLFVLQQLCHLLLWQKLPYVLSPPLSCFTAEE